MADHYPYLFIHFNNLFEIFANVHRKQLLKFRIVTCIIIFIYCIENIVFKEFGVMLKTFLERGVWWKVFDRVY